MRLDEKYRPTEFSEVIGQGKAVGILESIASRASDLEYPFGGRYNRPDYGRSVYYGRDNGPGIDSQDIDRTV